MDTPILIIQELNNTFNRYNIFLNNAGHDFIDDSNYYNIDAETYTYSQLKAINNNANAINFYLVDVLRLKKDGQILRYSGVSNTPSNSLCINNDSALAVTSSHELGHALNLLHTHEEEDFGPTPINNSNCDSNGDLLCDTPADPNLRGEVDSNCVYTGGGGYNPLTNNIMSYAPRFCRDTFTSDQVEEMKTALDELPILQPVVSISCAIPELNGPNLVCNSTTYTLQNGGNNVTWQVSSNLQKVSSSNTEITVKAKYTTSQGGGLITASYNNGAEATKDVWVGKPYNYADAVDPICTNQYSQEYTLKASPGASSYRLVSTSPNLLINFSNEVTFTDAPKKVYFSSTSDGYYQVNLYTTNECGTTQGIIYVRSESCTGGGGGMYSVYPNPASSEVNIASNTGKTTAKPESQSSLYQQTRQIAKLFDFNGAFVKDIELDPYGTTKMDVSNLKEGYYFLKIQVREEEETHKIIVSH